MSRIEENGPWIVRARLIDERRIELYWSSQVRDADRESSFRVTCQGRELELIHWINDGESEWNYGTVYQKESLRTTLTVKDEIIPELRNQVEVQVVKNVVDLMDRPADYKRIYSLQYSPYYVKQKKTQIGICVRAGETVADYSLELAGKIIDLMLSKIPEVAKKLIELHGDVGIFGLEENAYDIPEHRMGYLLATRPVEGFGGIISNPISTVAEANLIRLRTGRYATRYPNEMILVHEFGHAIHLIGIDHLEDLSLSRKIQECYTHAKEAGLWKDTYAISNHEEYFATLGTVWFNVMQEGVDGKWDGIRGPVNTREELKEYDAQGYQLMKSIYPGEQMPAPWNYNVDFYDKDGNPRCETGSYHRELEKIEWKFIQ